MTATDLRSMFTEATLPEIVANDVPATAAYQDALRRLSRALHCAATEEAVLAARAHQDPQQHADALLRQSGTGAMLVDFGFAGPDAFTLEEQRHAVMVTQREVVRLEQVAEQLVDTAGDPREWFEAVRAVLRSRIAAGAAGVKSIAAYRAGLHMRRVDPELVVAALRRLQARRARGEAVRLEGAELCHPLLREAAIECAAIGVPLQVHCGVGDTDLDLAACSPLGLRPLLTDPHCRGLRLVLLHCYPFHREAAYICAVYANVFMDLSLALPLAGLDGVRAMQETLGLCPWTRLLYASDASRLPEYFLVAASVHREALARAFGELVDRDSLGSEQALAAGAAVLRDNARRLYQLAGDVA